MSDSITDPQSQSSGSANSTFHTVDSAPVSSAEDNQRVLARQTPTGNQRGTQTVTGTQTVKDPVTNNPVIKSSGPDQQLTFTDPVSNVNQIIIGKLPDGTYGFVVSKPGVDASSLFA